jgi:lysophospholipase L1-like esterase
MMEKNKDNRKREAWVKPWKVMVFLLLLSIAIPLVAAEIYFRLTSPYIIRKDTQGLTGKEVTGDYGYFMDMLSGRRLIPNTHVVRVQNYNKIPIDINSNGFRDNEIPAIKNPGETRILVLGDSITFGANTTQEYTYAKRAEAYLAAESQAGQIRIINGGVEGIGTKDEIDILIDQGLAISPDIVVVGFYLNDGNPPDRLAAGLANPGFIRKHSVLAQTIYRTYKFRQYSKGEMEEAFMYGWLTSPPPQDWRTNRDSLLQYAAIAEKDWGAAWNPDTWAGIDEQMKRLQVLAKDHNFKVVIASFPIVFQVDAEYLENEPQQRLKALADKYHFQFLDLLPVFRSNSDRNIFFDWCHLSNVGHDIVGMTLARFLSEHVLYGERHSRDAAH